MFTHRIILNYSIKSRPYQFYDTLCLQRSISYCSFFWSKTRLGTWMIKVGTIYLAQTMIPSIAVAELGIRGNVALFFLNDVVINEELKIGIVSATFTLWLINLIVPAIFGAIFILRLKFFKNK